MTLEAFLSELLQGLTDAGVRYCILRNHDQLPDYNVGTDVDLLVHPNDHETALACLQAIHGVDITSRVHRSQVTHTFLAGVEWDGNEALQVDFIRSNNWKGLPFIDTEYVLARCKEAGSDRPLIRIPHPADEAITSLFASLLPGGWIKQRYMPNIRSTFIAEAEQVRQTLEPAFGSKIGVLLIDAVTSDEENRCLSLVPKLRRRLARHSFRKHPLISARAIASHYAREIQVRWTPRYCVDVSLVGLDHARRLALAEKIAVGARYMAKEIDVRDPHHHPNPQTDSDQSLLRSALALIVPRTRSSSLRLWTNPPFDNAARWNNLPTFLVRVLWRLRARHRLTLVLKTKSDSDRGIKDDGSTARVHISAESSEEVVTRQSVRAVRHHMASRVARRMVWGARRSPRV